MLIMTFLIAQGQSHVLKFNLLFQLNITEAKLFFDMTGFEPRTSGSADLQYSILTTRPQRPLTDQCYITNMT